ncbi:uncharacterized protein LOC120160578 [Hibiscus syriacus]|uniref:uncharacterized protein LOC120160578 n=1 Tax=Hibiscus syriacus TaxID=106335 RepID=UPI0019221C4B|nr:uncharacterized protein LOC120160578 [Hibiscus syriacus]
MEKDISDNYHKPLNPVNTQLSELRIHPPISASKKSGTAWYPPPYIIKINVDGAFIANSNDAAIGVIARDQHGMVIGRVARKLNPPNTSESTEALAFIHRFRFAIENGRQQVLIEGDAISIVDRLANRREDISIVGLLLNVVQEYIANNPSFKVLYLNRGANRVAHALATWALSRSNPYWFYYDEPDCIKNMYYLMQLESN